MDSPSSSTPLNISESVLKRIQSYREYLESLRRKFATVGRLAETTSFVSSTPEQGQEGFGDDALPTRLMVEWAKLANPSVPLEEFLPRFDEERVRQALERLELCGTCIKTGECQCENAPMLPGRHPRPDPETSLVQWQPCGVYRKHWEARKVQVAVGVPFAFCSATLRPDGKGIADSEDIRSELLGFARSVAAKSSGGVITIIGGRGSGKSYLACATMLEVMRINTRVKCLYVNARELGKFMNECNAEPDTITRHEVLVVDDVHPGVGAGRLSDFMSILLSSRADLRLATIVTCSYSAMLQLSKADFFEYLTDQRRVVLPEIEI